MYFVFLPGTSTSTDPPTEPSQAAALTQQSSPCVAKLQTSTLNLSASKATKSPSLLSWLKRKNSSNGEASASSSPSSKVQKLSKNVHQGNSQTSCSATAKRSRTQSQSGSKNSDMEDHVTPSKKIKMEHDTNLCLDDLIQNAWESFFLR